MGFIRSMIEAAGEATSPLAMEAHSMAGGWQLVEPDTDVPPHPDDLQPIASLAFA